MSGSVRKALLNVLEWSGGPTRVLESGLETLLNVQESLPDVREWSGVFLECPGVVVSPSWMSESGRESLLNVREWLGGPH